MLFFNFLCLFYLMVLIRCHTISKSITDYDELDDGIDSLSQYQLTTVFSVRHDRFHSKHKREDETGKYEEAGKETPHIANTTEPTTKSKEKTSTNVTAKSTKSTKRKKGTKSVPTTTKVITREATTTFPELLGTSTPTMNFFRRLQHKFGTKNKTKHAKHTTKKHKHKKHKDSKAEKTSLVDRDKRYVITVRYVDHNESILRNYKNSPRSMINFYKRNSKAEETPNDYLEGKTDSDDSNVTPAAANKESNDMDPLPYTSPSEKYSLPQDLDSEVNPFHGTADIETLLNKIKLSAMDVIFDHNAVVEDIIRNSVTETTFETDPLLHSITLAVSNNKKNKLSLKRSPKKTFDKPSFLEFQDESAELSESIENNANNANTHIKDDKQHGHENLEHKLQREIKDALTKAKDTLAGGLNKACDQVKSVTWKVMHHTAARLSSIASTIHPLKSTSTTTSKSTIQSTIMTNKETLEPTPSTKKPKNLSKKQRKSAFFDSNERSELTSRQHRETSTEPLRDYKKQTLAEFQDDYSMLQVYENVLAKKHKDNIMKMLPTRTLVPKGTLKNKNNVLKRDADYVTNINDNESTSNLDNNSDLKNKDNSISDQQDEEDIYEGNPSKITETTIRELASPDNSFEGLTSKIHYKEFINGYKNYLNFAKDMSKFDHNYSDRVCYEAHRHHSVDDIGKFILMKLPTIPDWKPVPTEEHREKRYLLEDSDSENNEVTTKNQESWFRRHFYVFHDKPKKKFHSQQTVNLKMEDAVQHRIANHKYSTNVSKSKPKPAESEGFVVRWNSRPIHKKRPRNKISTITLPWESFHREKEMCSIQPNMMQKASMMEKLSEIDSNLNDVMKKIGNSPAGFGVSEMTTSEISTESLSTELPNVMSSMDLNDILAKITTPTHAYMKEFMSALVLRNYTLGRIKKWHIENPRHVIHKFLAKPNPVKDNETVNIDEINLQEISRNKRDKMKDNMLKEDYDHMNKYTLPMTSITDKSELLATSDNNLNKLGYVDLTVIPKPPIKVKPKLKKSKYKKIFENLRFKKTKKLNSKKPQNENPRKERSALKILKSFFKVQKDPLYSSYPTEPYNFKFQYSDIERNVKELMNHLPNISKDLTLEKPLSQASSAAYFAPTEANFNSILAVTKSPINTYYSAFLTGEAPPAKKNQKNQIAFKTKAAGANFDAKPNLYTLRKQTAKFHLKLEPVTLNELLKEENMNMYTIKYQPDSTTPATIYYTPKLAQVTPVTIINKNKRMPNNMKLKFKPYPGDNTSPKTKLNIDGTKYSKRTTKDPPTRFYMNNYVYDKYDPYQTEDYKNFFRRFDIKEGNSALILHDNKHMEEATSRPSFFLSTKLYRHTKPYKAIPDYLGDFINWNRDILDLERVTVSQSNEQSNISTANLSRMMDEVMHMKNYLKDLSAFSTKGRQKTYVTTRKSVGPHRQQKYTRKLNKEMSTHDKTRRQSFEKPKYESGEHVNEIVSNINKIYHDSFKKYSTPESTQIEGLILTPLFRMEDTTTTSSPLETTLLAYDDSVDGISSNEVEQPDPELLRLRMKQSTILANKTKIIPQPEQYFRTPVPMKPKDFDKFLKDSGLDVQDITAPDNEASQFEEKWERGMHVESKLMDTSGKQVFDIPKNLGDFKGVSPKRNKIAAQNSIWNYTGVANDNRVSSSHDQYVYLDELDNTEYQEYNEIRPQYFHGTNKKIERKNKPTERITSSAPVTKPLNFDITIIDIDDIMRIVRPDDKNEDKNMLTTLAQSVDSNTENNRGTLSFTMPITLIEVRPMDPAKMKNLQKENTLKNKNVEKPKLEEYGNNFADILFKVPGNKKTMSSTTFETMLKPDMLFAQTPKPDDKESDFPVIKMLDSSIEQSDTTLYSSTKGEKQLKDKPNGMNLHNDLLYSYDVEKNFRTSNEPTPKRTKRPVKYHQIPYKKKTCKAKDMKLKPKPTDTAVNKLGDLSGIRPANYRGSAESVVYGEDGAMLPLKSNVRYNSQPNLSKMPKGIMYNSQTVKYAFLFDDTTKRRDYYRKGSKMKSSQSSHDKPKDKYDQMSKASNIDFLINSRNIAMETSSNNIPKEVNTWNDHRERRKAIWRKWKVTPQKTNNTNKTKDNSLKSTKVPPTTSPLTRRWLNFFSKKMRTEKNVKDKTTKAPSSTSTLLIITSDSNNSSPILLVTSDSLRPLDSLQPLNTKKREHRGTASLSYVTDTPHNKRSLMLANDIDQSERAAPAHITFIWPAHLCKQDGKAKVDMSDTYVEQPWSKTIQRYLNIEKTTATTKESTSTIDSYSDKQYSHTKLSDLDDSSNENTKPVTKYSATDISWTPMEDFEEMGKLYVTTILGQNPQFSQTEMNPQTTLNPVHITSTTNLYNLKESKNIQTKANEKETTEELSNVISDLQSHLSKLPGLKEEITTIPPDITNIVKATTEFATVLVTNIDANKLNKELADIEEKDMTTQILLQNSLESNEQIENDGTRNNKEATEANKDSLDSYTADYIDVTHKAIDPNSVAEAQRLVDQQRKDDEEAQERALASARAHVKEEAEKHEQNIACAKKIMEARCKARQRAQEKLLTDARKGIHDRITAERNQVAEAEKAAREKEAADRRTEDDRVKKIEDFDGFLRVNETLLTKSNRNISRTNNRNASKMKSLTTNRMKSPVKLSKLEFKPSFSTKNVTQEEKLLTSTLPSVLELFPKKTVNSGDLDRDKSQILKVFKRQTSDDQNTVYTAKDVAALEVIVDLLKEPGRQNVGLMSQNKSYSQTSTNAIQIRIGVPYIDKKRSAESSKLRKVFSAKMSVPVDIEYQVRSLDVFDRTESYTADPSNDNNAISPGMYLLVEDTKQNKGFALRPLNRKIKQDISVSTIKPTTLTKMTLSKDEIQSINKQLLQYYQNLSSIEHTSKHSVNKRHDKNIGRRYRRIINWKKVKHFFGYNNKRVCDCKCYPNRTMCKACLASDAVMTELLFEFENLAKYMSDHCTEIQTFFWMNPSGGRKLRDVIRKIEKNINDYYKRVEGKCRGRPCQTLDKREVFEPKFVHDNIVRDIGKPLLNEFEDLASSLQQAEKMKLDCNEKFKNIVEHLVKVSNACIMSKVKRSPPEHKKKYSLDNINVNIICNQDVPFDVPSTTSSITDLSTSDNLLDYTDDEVKKTKTFNSFKQLFQRKPKKSKQSKRDTIVKIEPPMVVADAQNLWNENLKDARVDTSTLRTTLFEPVVTLGVLERTDKNMLPLNPTLKATLLKVNKIFDNNADNNNADDALLQILSKYKVRREYFKPDTLTNKPGTFNKNMRLIEQFEGLPGDKEVWNTAITSPKLYNRSTEKFTTHNTLRLHMIQTPQDAKFSETFMPTTKLAKEIDGNNEKNKHLVNVNKRDRKENIDVISDITTTSYPTLFIFDDVAAREAEKHTLLSNIKRYENSIIDNRLSKLKKREKFNMEDEMNDILMLEQNKVLRADMNATTEKEFAEGKYCICKALEKLKNSLGQAGTSTKTTPTTTTAKKSLMVKLLQKVAKTQKAGQQAVEALGLPKVEDKLHQEHHQSHYDHHPIQDQHDDIKWFLAQFASTIIYTDFENSTFNVPEKTSAMNHMSHITADKFETYGYDDATNTPDHVKSISTEATKQKSTTRKKVTILSGPPAGRVQNKFANRAPQKIESKYKNAKSTSMKQTKSTVPTKTSFTKSVTSPPVSKTKFTTSPTTTALSAAQISSQEQTARLTNSEDNIKDTTKPLNPSISDESIKNYDQNTNSNDQETTRSKTNNAHDGIINNEHELTSNEHDTTTNSVHEHISSDHETTRIAETKHSNQETLGKYQNKTNSEQENTSNEDERSKIEETKNSNQETTSSVHHTTINEKDNTITKYEETNNAEEKSDSQHDAATASNNQETNNPQVATNDQETTITTTSQLTTTSTKRKKLKSKGEMFKKIQEAEKKSETILKKLLNKELGRQRSLKEACDPKTEACLCDLAATSSHVAAVRKTMTTEHFELYVRNVSCYQYERPPPYFLLEHRQKLRRSRNQKPTRLNKYFDPTPTKNSLRWDWIREKRSLPSSEDLDDRIDEDDIVLDDYFNEEITNSEGKHYIDHVNVLKDFNDDRDFETLFKGNDNIYKLMKKRLKRNTRDMKELVRGLKNLPPLQSRENELFAMLGDRMSLDCLHRARARKGSDTPVFWDSERSNMLSSPDVVVDGPLVLLKKVQARNSGNYTCSQDGKAKSVKLTVVTLPHFFIVFIPMYSSKQGCSYEDLRAAQRLGPLISKSGCACAGNSSMSIQIDEPICLEDKDDGSTHVRATAIHACAQPAVRCSAQCRRDLQCALALLCAANAPVLYGVKVLLAKQGYNKTMVPSFQTNRRLIITHTLRKKELHKHPEYHQLAASMLPGDLDIVVSCPAGYYLLPTLKICAACPADTYAAYGENTCRSCAVGTSAEPGAARCGLSLRRMRRYDWWWYPPCGFAVAALGVLCACVVCTACAVGAHVTSCSSTRAHAAAVSVARVDSRWTWSRRAAVKRYSSTSAGGATRGEPPSPSAVILARFFRPSASSSRATGGVSHDSQEIKQFEQWKEKNIPPPLPPVDFDLS